jgi:exportin-5
MLDIAFSALPPRSLASSHGLLGIDARPSQAAADLVARSLSWQPRDPMLRACRLQLLCAARNPLSAPTLAAEVEAEAASSGGFGGGAASLSSPPRASSPAPPASDSPGQQAQRAQQVQALSALNAQLPQVLEACFQCMEANEAWESEPLEATAAGAAGTAAGGSVSAPSEPVAALRRRAGGALIALGRALPKELEPHLGSLAARVEAMATRGALRPMQKMHCLEMLVAVSNAVPDPARRTTLVGQAAGESVREWCSPEVTEVLASPQALLTNCLGIEAAPNSVGADPAVVTAVHAKVRLVGNCLNTLNSIARRVHVPANCAAWADALGSASDGSASSTSAGSEGGSAFAPLWPMVLPNLIQLIRVLHGIWAPECSHVLRGASSSAGAPLSPVAAGGGGAVEGWTPLSHVLSMHEQELHVKSNLSGITQKKQDLMGGNDGGHASQIEGGGGGGRDNSSSGDQDQHDHMDSGGSEVQSLEEMRCRWLSELRTLAYALLGIAAQQGALYTIDGAFSAATACLLHELEHVEHRHLSLLLKHAAEPMVLHCPPRLHATLLPPLLAPLLSHTLQRLTITWQAASAASSTTTANPLGAATALAPTGPTAADAIAWRTVAAAYRRDGGAVLGPEVPEATKELVIDKCRRELTRTHVAVLQSWLALSGELARAFINYDGVGKPWGSGGSLEAAGSSGGASGSCGTSTLGGFSGALAPPKNGRSLDSAPLPYASGAATAAASEGGGMDAAHGHAKVPRAPALAREAAAKRQHADNLARFLFLGNPSIAYPLAGTITAALLWPDGVQCRKAITAAHRMVGCTHAEPLFEPLLGTHLMQTAVYALVTEPKWLAGLEWDLLNLARDLYCLLAIGLAPDRLTYAVASAQGAANAAASGAGVTSPRGASGIPAHHFAAVAGRPRAVLLNLPGVGPPQVAALDAALSQATDAKAQKDAMRDLLRAASEAIHASAADSSSTAAAGSVPPAESALRVRPPAILDLPRQMWAGNAAGGPLGGAAAGSAAGGGGEEALAGLAFLFDGTE